MDSFSSGGWTFGTIDFGNVLTLFSFPKGIL